MTLLLGRVTTGLWSLALTFYRRRQVLTVSAWQAVRTSAAVTLKWVLVPIIGTLPWQRGTAYVCEDKNASTSVKWHVALAATTGNTILVPYWTIKSLQLIRGLGTSRRILGRVPDFQKDLEWLGLKIGHQDINPSNVHQIHNGCNYLSMLWFGLIYASKMGPMIITNLNNKLCW